MYIFYLHYAIFDKSKILCFLEDIVLQSIMIYSCLGEENE